MSAGVAFSFEDAERRFGPAVVAESKRAATAAPRLRPEQIAHLQALFGSARIAKPRDLPSSQEPISAKGGG